MAEESTSVETSVETPEEGQSQQTSETPRQEPSGSKVNLQELEDFKKYQAQVNQTLAQKEKQYQQQVQALQQDLDALRTKGMTKEERYQYEIQRKEQALAQVQQQNQALYSQIAQKEAMQEIANRLAAKTGISVPVNIMEAASGPDDAWEKGLEYALKEKEKEYKARNQRKESAATPVDTGRGSGAAETNAARTRRIAEAKKSGNVLDLIRAYASED